MIEFWIFRTVAPALVGLLAGAGVYLYAYERGVNHERERQAAFQLQIEQKDERIRKDVDSAVSDIVSDGDLDDSLQPFYRD